MGGRAAVGHDEVMSEPTTQKQRDERATSERSVLDQIAERSLATRIVRWREGRVIGGVARGIAGRYDIDPVLVRVAFAVTAFIGGFGLAAYLLAWVLLPDEDGAVPLVQAAREKSAGPLALVVLAALVAAGTLFDSNDNGGGLRFLGLIALAVAGWWFWRRADGRDGGGRDEGAAPAAASAPSVGTGADAVAPPAEPTQDAPVAATMPVITPWGGPDGERFRALYKRLVACNTRVSNRVGANVLQHLLDHDLLEISPWEKRLVRLVAWVQGLGAGTLAMDRAEQLLSMQTDIFTYPERVAV